MVQPLPDLFAGADPAAAGRIRRECGWHVAPVWQEERYVVRQDPSLILLPTLRLISVDSVRIDGELLEPTSYKVDLAVGGIRMSHFPSTPLGALVQFTHGYTECPPELAACAAQLARQSRAAGYGQVSIGQVRVAATAAGPDGLDPYVSSLLSLYRLPPRT